VHLTFIIPLFFIFYQLNVRKSRLLTSFLNVMRHGKIGIVMGGTRVKNKIAVVGCEKRVFPIKVRGKVRTIRGVTAEKFKELGLETEIHHPVSDIDDFPKPGTFGALIIGGSSLSIHGRDLEENPWMHKLMDFILESCGKVPMLGLCFGHQAIARAHNVPIQRFGPEIVYEAGFSPVCLTEAGKKDPLFRMMPPVFAALFSHYDYLSHSPENGETLLVGPNNPSIQGYRLGECTWGLQYHPEFTAESVHWLISERRNLLEARVDVDAILATLSSEYRKDDIVLRNFADIVQMA